MKARRLHQPGDADAFVIESLLFDREGRPPRDRACGHARPHDAAEHSSEAPSAFGYRLLAVPLAAGVPYPAFGVTSSPMIAAAAMSLSSVSVVTNSLRLRNALR